MKFLAFLLLVSYVPPSLGDNTLPSKPSENRSVNKKAFLVPSIASFLLPGFDQWWEGQYLPATIYSSGGLIGAIGSEIILKDEEPLLFSNRDAPRLKYILGKTGELGALIQDIFPGVLY